MSFRTTILMAVILAVLGSLYYFRDKVSAPENPDEAPPLTTLKADDLVALQIKLPKQTIDLQKQDGTWYIVKPRHVLANSHEMSQIVPQLAEMKAVRAVASDVAAAGFKQYGLDKPAAVFTLGVKDGSPVVLKVGGRTPNDSGYYVRVGDGDKVYIAANELTGAINRTFDDWREKNPITFETDKADRISVLGPKIDLQLEKAKATGDAAATPRWDITKPKAAPAETDAVQKYLAAIKNVVITKFLNDVPPDKVKPVYTFKVWTAGERDPATIIVGGPVPREDGFYAVRGSKVKEVFVFPRLQLENVLKDPSTFADRHMFPIKVEDAAKGEIMHSAAGSAAAEKSKDGGWKFTRPLDKADDLGKMTALAYTLKEVKYERKLTLPAEIKKASQTLIKPYAKFDLWSAQGGHIASLTVGGKVPGGSRRYVRGLDAKAVYEADVPFVDDWKMNLKALKPSPSPKPK